MDLTRASDAEQLPWASRSLLRCKRPQSTMSSTTVTSLSFQPWTQASTDETSLKDVLARVNDERGHFRDITEASLQEEIATEGALELSEGEEDEEDEEEDEAEGVKGKTKPSTREDLFRAKFEMLASVRAAEQDILMSLDFVSLLLSKDVPKQAQSTISSVLKEAVPLGSLGTDLWQRMPVDKAREAEDELLATNARMEGLHQSADALLSAATRFQETVKKENMYWDQVLSISEEGWNVCRIPGQQRRLGVRFGFSESAPEFSRRGIAALNPRADGSIALDRGIGSKRDALRVTLQRNRKIVGMSRLPEVFDVEETTLEARIRNARDSLYDEELYHEMIRESRSLASLGMSMKGPAIHYGSDLSDLQVSFDLVSLDDDNNHSNGLLEVADNASAQAILLAARLLLSQAHRDRLHKRSQVPPPLSENQANEKTALPILRPIMSMITHRSSLDRLNAYVETLTGVFDAASIRNSVRQAQFQRPEGPNITKPGTLISTFMQPFNSEAQLKITTTNDEELTVDIQVNTSLAQGGFGSSFSLTTSHQSAPIRFDNFDELVAATDIKVAGSLAQATSVMLGEEWMCNWQEALLVKDVGIGEKSESMWITLDSRGKTLSLSSLKNAVAWTVGGANPNTQSFWDAARDLA